MALTDHAFQKLVLQHLVHVEAMVHTTLERQGIESQLIYGLLRVVLEKLGAGQSIKEELDLLGKYQEFYNDHLQTITVGINTHLEPEDHLAFNTNQLISDFEM